WRSGDAGALDAAVAIRKLFDGKPLVPGVKAILAHIHGDAAWARVKPPLTAFPASEQIAVATSYDGLRTPASARLKIGATPAQAALERGRADPLNLGGAATRRSPETRHQPILCRLIRIERARCLNVPIACR